MIKRFLLFYAGLCMSLVMSAQSVTITEATGWLESALVKWTPVTGADSYNVYYTGGGFSNKKIDTQLIRKYASYMRADVMGLAAGTYTIKVAPVTAGVEGTATESSPVTVIAQDRSGFAFDGGRVPGGYNADGTLKSGALVFYITENTKNTVAYDVITSSKNAVTNYVGLQNILYGIKKGYDTRPYVFRLIGNITDMTVMEGGDITIENANNASSYITIEGVGSDAVVNGMGIRLKSASNVEVRNLGFMNCNSTAGDNVGMQQDNDHIWVHNCDMFYGDAGSDADQVKGDGALDNKNSTYCTFSYNHFWDNGKCSLLGLSEGTTTGLYVSYHHNWFDHSDSRHPRIRFYSAHVYNNYYDGNAKYGVGSTMGSSVFVEGNYFRDCKHPMMTSMQGTDVWNESTQVNDPNNMGTFSGEDGGSIKAFNNVFDASNGANNMRFVPYGSTNASFNIAGKISSTTDFDAYLATTRGETVPATVVSKQGGNKYNNFDTDAALYVKNLVVDEPAVARDKAIQYAGRVTGGDLRFTYNNAVDDAAYLVNTTEKTALMNYQTSLVSVQGDVVTPVSQTLTLTSGSNSQTITSGSSITSIVYTWGGSATGATVTGLDGTGLTATINATAQTVTIAGTPTTNVSYSISSTGTSGIAVTATGSVTVNTPSTQTITLTSGSSAQNVTSGNAITSIVYTWGGTATGATVTGLDGTGLTYTTNATAQTVTISGTPTSSVSYTVTTSGASGTSVSATGTIGITSTGNMVQNFTTSGISSTFYTISGNLTTSYGTASYSGLTLTQALKMESATTITFTTTATASLTLVLSSSYTGTVKVDGTVYTPASGIITISSLPAGAHTIVKGSGSNYLFYMSTAYTTGVHEIAGLQARLYPNPVVDMMMIKTDATVLRTEVYNLAGMKIKQLTGEVKVVDMSDLSSGTYLINVQTKDGSYRQKFVKK